MVLSRLLHQTFQQKICQAVDMGYMQPAFPVTKFHDLAQNTNHNPVILLFLINLVRDHLNETALLCVKFDGVKDTLKHHLASNGRLM